MLTDARTEAENATSTARRAVDDLTRQKDAVTAQLGQMLSGLAGIVPTQQPPAEAEHKSPKTAGAGDNGATKITA